MRVHHALLGLLLILVGCESQEPRWTVDLRTDLAPVAEFAGVEARVTAPDAAEGPPTLRAQRIAARGDDYIEGQRIAEWRDVPSHQVLLTVALLDGDGEVVASASQLLVPPRNGATLVLVTRSCRAVSCPTGQLCRDGLCIPECGPDDCESMCSTSTDCSEAAACARRRCVDGVCLYEDDGECGAGAYCDPEVGCLPLPASDAGAEVDGGVPTDAAGACGGCSTQESCCAGSCTDTAADRAHCGACGNACADGVDCCAGTCVDTRSAQTDCGACGNDCGTARACCDSTCVSLDSDPGSCGTCGTTCDPAESCCGGVCIDTSTDAMHCGLCGNACSTEFVCADGECCPAGHDYCDGACRDLQNDDDHCGTCGNVCSVLSSCSSGVCRAL